MANADRHNSAQSIKITPSLFVEHVLRFALHNHQRLFVVEEESPDSETGDVRGGPLPQMVRGMVGADNRTMLAQVFASFHVRDRPLPLQQACNR